MDKWLDRLFAWFIAFIALSLIAYSLYVVVQSYRAGISQLAIVVPMLVGLHYD